MARFTLALVLVAFCSLALASPLVAGFRPRIAFEQFVQRYNKSYASGKERLERYEIFAQNLAFIEAFNRAGNASFTVAVNAYADLTNAEFRAMLNGYKYDPNRPVDVVEEIPSRPEVVCPSNGSQLLCDWRVAGVVTPVKNQGQCGSCWAFSAVASTEGAHALATKKLVSLSEQNLVDCSTAEGNQGCNGGLMDQAFEYIIKNKGIDTEASYPYAGVEGKCKYSAQNIGASITSYKNLPKGNEQTLETAVQNIGPISVAIDASLSSFQFYSSGVYFGAGCSQTQLDHGVTVVGYGVDGADDFWLVKNSWGTSWGLSGYIWMSRNRNNNCGIATMPSYPIA